MWFLSKKISPYFSNIPILQNCIVSVLDTPSFPSPQMTNGFSVSVPDSRFDFIFYFLKSKKKATV